MPTITFLGVVYPHGWQVTFPALPEVAFQEDDVGLVTKVRVSINTSQVKVECECNREIESWRVRALGHASRVASAAINLAAFHMGVGATTVIDREIDSLGHVSPVIPCSPEVAHVCTAFSATERLPEVFALAISERAVISSMDDLIGAISTQNHTVINCARSLEAIRQMVAGYELSPNQQWPIFRERLNIDRSYVEMIMNYSKDHRHGKPISISAEAITTIVFRTWSIMDRFLNYRLGGNQSLPLVSYPLLKE